MKKIKNKNFIFINNNKPNKKVKREKLMIKKIMKREKRELQN